MRTLPTFSHCPGTGCFGPKRTLTPTAANGGFEPIATIAALRTNWRNTRYADIARDGAGRARQIPERDAAATQLHRTGRRRTVQHDRLGDRQHCGLSGRSLAQIEWPIPAIAAVPFGRRVDSEVVQVFQTTFCRSFPLNGFAAVCFDSAVLEGLSLPPCCSGQCCVGCRTAGRDHASHVLQPLARVAKEHCMTFTEIVVPLLAVA